MKRECIDLDGLIRYFEGSLSEEKEAEIMKHITQCPECLETFSSANHIMGNREIDEWKPLTEKAAGRIIKRILPEPARKEDKKSFFQQISEWGSGLFPQQKFAAVRSDSVYNEDVCLIRKKDDLQTEIYLEKSETDNVTIKIRILDGNKTAENIILTLIKREEGKIFAQYLRDDSTDFDEIPLGCYQLIIEQNERETDKFFFEICKDEIYELNIEDGDMKL